MAPTAPFVHYEAPQCFRNVPNAFDLGETKNSTSTVKPKVNHGMEITSLPTKRFRVSPLPTGKIQPWYVRCMLASYSSREKSSEELHEQNLQSVFFFKLHSGVIRLEQQNPHKVGS